MTEQGINELAARRDEQWEEVIELCRRYGYLTQEQCHYRGTHALQGGAAA